MSAWSVIHLSSDPRESSLLCAQLLGGGFNATVDRVDTAAALAAALTTGKPVLVVADAPFPWLGADHDLDRLTADGKTPPVIMRWGPPGSRTTEDEQAQLLRAVGERVRVSRDAMPADRVQRAERLEVLGALASGIAHDFNNLLTVIRGCADIARADLGVNPTVAEELLTIQTATERGRTLISRLLAFGRPQAPIATTIDLDRFVRDLLPILQRLAGSTVTVSFETTKPPHLVRISALEIEQILLNLVANAQHAMADGGRLDIRLRTAADQIGAGSRVELSVTDNGAGMNAATLARIFEPFFTTRRPDGGTGLGLASAREIVRRNGGEIAVTSTPGIGSSFTVILPQVLDSTPPAGKTHAEDEGGSGGAAPLSAGALG